MASPIKPSSALLASPLLRAASRFFAWWGGELAGLVPAGLRAWWREADRVLMLSFADGRGTLTKPAANGRQELLAFDAGNDLAAQRNVIGRQLARIAGKNARLLVGLPPARILRRTVSLPLAVEENLRQTLTFELDRYTPFKPDQVYFDFRILARNPAQRRMTVELAAVERSVVDQEVAKVTALGLSTTGAIAADELPRGTGFMNFLPAAAAAGTPASRMWWRLGLGTLATLLLAALLAVPIWQKRAAAIALLDPLARARTAAQETDALRDRMTHVVEEYSFLVDMKWASPSTLLVLEELSKRLPDDTFIVQFDYDGKTVQLQGESATAAGLVEVLENSPLFKDVGFKAQLTKIQGTANDRFHLAATLEPDARPKPTPGAASQPAPAPAIAEPAPSPAPTGTAPAAPTPAPAPAPASAPAPAKAEGHKP